MNTNTSKLMQSLLRTSGICGAVAAVGMTLTGDALAGISNTKHNLTATSAATNKSSGTEICAFCHTPHASNTAATGAPLWNKAVGAASSYSVYSSTSLDSGSGTAGSPGAASLACLSCHDGSQAMDNMINAPGSGGWTSSGGSAGYTWTGATGGRLGSVVTNLTQDLRNDHPIGIEYAGGGYSKATAPGGGNKATCITCIDKDFWEPTQISSSSWYVNVNGTAGKQKDDIQLYPASGAGTTVTVECGSCHDPHVEAKTGGSQTAFLRVSQVNSGLCLSCHNK